MAFFSGQTPGLGPHRLPGIARIADPDPGPDPVLTTGTTCNVPVSLPSSRLPTTERRATVIRCSVGIPRHCHKPLTPPQSNSRGEAGP